MFCSPRRFASYGFVVMAFALTIAACGGGGGGGNPLPPPPTLTPTPIVSSTPIPPEAVTVSTSGMLVDTWPKTSTSATAFFICSARLTDSVPLPTLPVPCSNPASPSTPGNTWISVPLVDNGNGTVSASQQLPNNSGGDLGVIAKQYPGGVPELFDQRTVNVSSQDGSYQVLTSPSQLVGGPATIPLNGTGAPVSQPQLTVSQLGGTLGGYAFHYQPNEIDIMQATGCPPVPTPGPGGVPSPLPSCGVPVLLFHSPVTYGGTGTNLAQQGLTTDGSPTTLRAVPCTSVAPAACNPNEGDAYLGGTRCGTSFFGFPYEPAENVQCVFNGFVWGEYEIYLFPNNMLGTSGGLYIYVADVRVSTPDGSSYLLLPGIQPTLYFGN